MAADETLDAVAWGVARTALPETDLPFQTDLTSELEVSMVSGSLASVSNLEMLNGRRAGLCRGECDRRDRARRPQEWLPHRHDHLRDRRVRGHLCHGGRRRRDLRGVGAPRDHQRGPGGCHPRRSLDHLSGQEDLTMAWGSDTAATQLTGITTEQFFNQVPTLNPRETAHVQVSVDFPTSPTDHAIVAVYTTLDNTSEVFDLIPMMVFLIENTTDPNRISSW
jgi:hypothetical protein